jgi:DNA processing protein
VDAPVDEDAGTRQPSGDAPLAEAAGAREPAEGGAPIAVLAAAPEIPYPARNRRLHAALAAAGCVVSELPPGSRAYRWSFVARNRIVAALAEVTVIVEATERSGSLTTADFAADLGRTVAAVPGRVTNATAAGTNGLLQAGAALVRGTADVLDLLSEATGRPQREPVRRITREGLDPPALELLAAVEDGRATLGELATGRDVKAVLAALGELEFRGLVRRTFGGRYEPAAR